MSKKNKGIVTLLVPIDKVRIEKYNVRLRAIYGDDYDYSDPKIYDGLDAMISSIKERTDKGLAPFIQPITVTGDHDNGYVLEIGHRRFISAKLAEVGAVNVIVSDKPLSDADKLAENEVREDQSFTVTLLEAAYQYHKKKATLKYLSAQTGVKGTYISILSKFYKLEPRFITDVCLNRESIDDKGYRLKELFEVLDNIHSHNLYDNIVKLYDTLHVVYVDKGIEDKDKWIEEGGDEDELRRRWVYDDDDDDGSYFYYIKVEEMQPVINDKNVTSWHIIQRLLRKYGNIEFIDSQLYATALAGKEYYFGDMMGGFVNDAEQAKEDIMEYIQAEYGEIKVYEGYNSPANICKPEEATGFVLYDDKITPVRNENAVAEGRERKAEERLNGIEYQKFKKAHKLFIEKMMEKEAVEIMALFDDDQAKASLPVAKEGEELHYREKWVIEYYEEQKKKLIELLFYFQGMNKAKSYNSDIDVRSNPEFAEKHGFNAIYQEVEKEMAEKEEKLMAIYEQKDGKRQAIIDKIASLSVYYKNKEYFPIDWSTKDTLKRDLDNLKTMSEKIHKNYATYACNAYNLKYKGQSNDKLALTLFNKMKINEGVNGVPNQEKYQVYNTLVSTMNHLTRKVKDKDYVKNTGEILKKKEVVQFYRDYIQKTIGVLHQEFDKAALMNKKIKTITQMNTEFVEQMVRIRKNQQ